VQIYYGIDDVFTSAVARPDAGRYLLYTGGWGQRKRIDVLLDAFERVASAEPDVRLVLTGDPGPHERALIAATKSDRVDLVGRVSDERLAELYAGAAALLYPSALEGFGFPVVEAFACGAPVIALRAGSVPEVAGDAAILIDGDDSGDVADAALEVLRDQGLASDLVSRGRARSKEFTWTRTADRTLQVYRELIQ
jgi:glycosyltransferase involved in cell wall biosynthesis